MFRTAIHSALFRNFVHLVDRVSRLSRRPQNMAIRHDPGPRRFNWWAVFFMPVFLACGEDPDADELFAEIPTAVPVAVALDFTSRIAEESVPGVTSLAVVTQLHRDLRGECDLLTTEQWRESAAQSVLPPSWSRALARVGVHTVSDTTRADPTFGYLTFIEAVRTGGEDQFRLLVGYGTMLGGGSDYLLTLQCEEDRCRVVDKRLGGIADFLVTDTTTLVGTIRQMTLWDYSRLRSCG